MALRRYLQGPIRTHLVGNEDTRSRLSFLFLDNASVESQRRQGRWHHEAVAIRGKKKKAEHDTPQMHSQGWERGSSGVL